MIDYYVFLQFLRKYAAKIKKHNPSQEIALFKIFDVLTNLFSVVMCQDAPAAGTPSYILYLIAYDIKVSIHICININF